MSLSMELWQIADEQLVPLDKATLNLEKRLENWIEKDVSLIGFDALIIGRQVHTGYGGYIDLLAINSDGELIIIELKKSKTPSNALPANGNIADPLMSPAVKIRFCQKYKYAALNI